MEQLEATLVKQLTVADAQRIRSAKNPVTKAFKLAGITDENPKNYAMGDTVTRIENVQVYGFYKTVWNDRNWYKLPVFKIDDDNAFALSIYPTSNNKNKGE